MGRSLQRVASFCLLFLFFVFDLFIFAAPSRTPWLANGLNDLPVAVLGLFASHWGVLVGFRERRATDVRPRAGGFDRASSGAPICPLCLEGFSVQNEFFFWGGLFYGHWGCEALVWLFCAWGIFRRGSRFVLVFQLVFVAVVLFVVGCWRV